MKANDRPRRVRSGRQRSCRINVAVRLRRDLPNYRLHSQLPPDEMRKGGGRLGLMGTEMALRGALLNFFFFFLPLHTCISLFKAVVTFLNAPFIRAGFGCGFKCLCTRGRGSARALQMDATTIRRRPLKARETL